jgi:glycogen debranching enzyme
MLQNIQDYTKMAPDGLSILSESVKRRFPKDDTWVAWNDERAYAYSSTIAEIIQEILQRHADGIHFREYNAGPNLDMQMKDEGFNIDIEVDWKTGLIFGGNAFNCGTWMDKMGESEKAGTKGKPGTPRDGAPVEITGLLKSTLSWLDGLANLGKFPFKGVKAQSESGCVSFSRFLNNPLYSWKRESIGDLWGMGGPYPTILRTFLLCPTG